ncbi:MlaE family ABC transporter permease [Diaphorobacter caeni]|uniref:MlaE family ABC transporter permease n=1 Tax=Diaphorobacter caeni TaxID=2784387 RepID=UPI00188FBE7C|nr:ABC transporter permease [Diaphorobacter caeni]MBF5005509.1 ABC transporter permease [Diaphorobacter caeni]
MQITNPPSILSERGNRSSVKAQGEWVSAAFADRQVWKRLDAQLESAGGEAEWDLQEIERLDHVGAQILWNHWGKRPPASWRLTPAQQEVFEQLERFSKVEAPPRTTPWLYAQMCHLGVLLFGAFVHFKDLVALIGQLVFDLGRLAVNPRKGPWRDISAHLYRMGATALPITALVGFLIGVVLAYLMSLQLRQFGAEAFIVNILGISLIRELGPMLGAILVAGRSGSAITAQIGVMRVTEELDALRVMGIPHGFRLVMPRALALGIAMPLVALWTTLAALAGGMLAADLAMNISPAYFVQALPAAVNVSNLWLAMGKSVVFGVFIALIGCHWGLSVEPNTQSLGEGTTASVVSAITMVIIVDALFAIAFKNVGF